MNGMQNFQQVQNETEAKSSECGFAWGEAAANETRIKSNPARAQRQRVSQGEERPESGRRFPDRGEHSKAILKETRRCDDMSRTTTRTPEKVGEEIRNLTAAAKYLTLWYAVEIGRRLTEAKALVDHGAWMDWLKKETEFSQPTASRFMKVYAEYGADQQSLFGAETKYSTLNNLSISNALRLLAVPAEEREEFAAAVDAEHLSARELEAAIEARKAAEEARDEAEVRAAAAAERNQELQASLEEKERMVYGQERVIKGLHGRVKELEQRPVDVAVQEPDPAEIERRAAELARASTAENEMKIRDLEEKAKAERDKLREKLKAAEDKLASAGGEDRAEAEQLRAQVETMRKQLAMSGGEMVTFRLRFEAWQGAYRDLEAALAALPPEQREKCAAAVKAQIEGWK